MVDTVKVTSRNVFQDSETGRSVVPGDVFEVTKAHAEDLMTLGLVEGPASAPAPAAKPASKAK